MKIKTTAIKVEMNIEDVIDIFCLLDDALDGVDSEKRRSSLDEYPLGKKFYLYLKNIIKENNHE